MFAVQRLRNFPVECHYRKTSLPLTTVLPHHIYRPHGITVKFSPSPRYLPWLPRFYRAPTFDNVKEPISSRGFFVILALALHFASGMCVHVKDEPLQLHYRPQLDLW